MTPTKKIKTIIHLTFTLLSLSALIASILITTQGNEVQAYQNNNEYHVRYQGNIPGGIVFTGNANGLSLNNEDAQKYDNIDIDSVGVFSSLDSSQSVPGYPAGTTLDWKKNGSAAKLDMPDNSQVEFAMLVWAGSYYWGTNTKATDSLDPATVQTPVTFSTSKGAYSISADPTYRYYMDTTGSDGMLRKEYSFTADVTDLVKNSGNGTYSVKGIPGILSNSRISTASPDNTNGWTLAVAYKNYSEKIKNVTLFSGTQLSNTPAVVISGFSTPTKGEISGKLFVSAFEGDASLTNDQLKFGKSENTLTPLKGPNNPETNFFNSQINGTDGKVDTTGTFGTYNTSNTVDDPITRHSYDITSVDVSPLLQTSQTQAYIRGTSSGDTYTINALGMQIEVNAPVIDTILSVDKSVTSVGDILTYTVIIKNDGSTDSLNTVSTAQIPEGTSFVQGSVISSRSYTGNNPADGLNFGTLVPDGSLTYSYQVKVESIPASKNYKNTARTDFGYQMTSTSPITNGSDQSNTVVTTLLQAPISAEDDVINSTPNNPVNINVLNNDSVPAGTTPTISIISNPSQGSVAIDGTKLVYTPNPNTIGKDSFTYRICYNQTQCDDAKVTINIPTGTPSVLGASDKPSPMGSTNAPSTSVLVRSGGLGGINSIVLVALLGMMTLLSAIMTGVTLMQPESEKNQEGEY